MMNRKLRTTILLLALAHTTLALADAGQNALKAERIITAGGSITEIMYALGLGENIVAVDTSSAYPPKVTSLPTVGYFRSLAAEGIMSLEPDMLIAAKGAGPSVVIKQVEALGVKVKTYEQSNYTLSSWQALITSIGNDFGKPDAASELIDKVTTKLRAHQRLFNSNARTINAVTLLSIGQRGPIAAGKNTVPNLLMQLAGLSNAASALDGYKPFSTELLAKQEIDMLLVPSHVVDGLGGKDAICKNPVVKMATSNKCNLFVMDGLLLMGFGARLDQAVSEIIGYAGEV